MNSRDPRIDPLCGDTVVKNGMKRTVQYRDGGDIRYASSTKNGTRIKYCWITTWQDWCRKAEVLHAAD